MKMDQSSISGPSTSSIRLSFWSRLTRISSAPNSPRIHLGKHAGEEAFQTPFRKSLRKGADSSFDNDHSEEDEESSPLTPAEVGLGSPKTALHSCIGQPMRNSNLPTTSSMHYSLESINLRPTGAQKEVHRDGNGHAAVLAGFLKNNGGYLDQSDSEEDSPPPPPILRARPRYIPTKPMQNRTRSIYSPVRCPGPPSPMPARIVCSSERPSGSPTRMPAPSIYSSSKPSGSLSPKPAPTRNEKAIQEVSSSSPNPKVPEVAKRRFEGQKAFRSLVLGEDDMLRILS